MQTYTVRPTILKHKANSKGITTIRICVTVNRKQTYLATEHRIHTDQWNEEGAKVVNHENAPLINISLRRKVADIEREMIGHSLEGTTITKKVIKGNNVIDKPFAQFAREVRADEKEITRLTNYAGEGIMLSEINVTFLRRYEQNERRRGMANNTINTSFKYFRRIINQAKAEKLIKENPFDEYNIPAYRQTDRVYLTIEEIKKILSHIEQFT